MPSELERDINEIKISVARIDERLKVFDAHVSLAAKNEERIRVLENDSTRLKTLCGIIGAIAGGLIALLIKLL